MTRDHDAGLPDAGAEALALRFRRLELDIQDLRFENARLKGSISEKQDEIMALSDRLGQFQRSKVWGRRLRRFNPLRLILRRLR